MEKTKALVKLSTSKWNLAKLWFIAGGILFVFMLWLTFGGYFYNETEIQTAWKWFFANMVPTLTLIMGVLVFDVQKTVETKSRMVDKKFYLLSLGVSVIYLFTISIHLVVPPFFYPNQMMKLISMSELWVSLVQGLVVSALGVFFIRQNVTANEAISAAVERIEGQWLQRITRTDGAYELSYFSITGDIDKTLNMEGQHFQADGKTIGHWESEMVEVDDKKLEVKYSWQGGHDADITTVEVEGFGKMNFYDKKGRIEQGYGGYVDIEKGEDVKAQWKSVRLKRVKEVKVKVETKVETISKEEIIKTMGSGDDWEKEALVPKIIKGW